MRKPQAARGASRTSLLFLALLACAAILPYAAALRNGFAFDDRPIIQDNPLVKGFDLAKIWTAPYWPPAFKMARLYRPLTITSFGIDWAIGGGRPQIFIAVNILIHLFVTLLVLRLIRRLFPRQPGVGWGAAFLFAVHPMHVEPVVAIVGRSELLSAFFVLLSYLIWLDAERQPGPSVRGLLAPGLWLLGLLSKESAIALPAILLLHRFAGLEPASRSRFRRADIAWAAAFAVALALRARAIGGLATPATPPVDNPIAHLAPILRVLGAGGVLARQLGQILVARHFSADYSFAQVSPGPALYVAGGIALGILAAAIVWASGRGGRIRPEGWGILFFSLTWCVTSNLIVPIGTVQADRLLYLPITGLFAAIVALVLRSPVIRSRRVALPVLAIATIGYGARAAARAPQWKDDRTLFEAAVRDAPRSYKSRCNLATEILHNASPDSARKALAILEPIAAGAVNYAPYLQAEAKARMFLGSADEARDLYHRALRAGADSAEVLIELGNIAIEKEDGAEALLDFDLVRRTGKKPLNAAIGHASALAIDGRYGEAADAWLPIVAMLPDSVPVRAACAWNLTQARRAGEAVDLVRAGLARRDDPRLENSLARALIGAGHAEEAVGAAEKAVGRDPSDANLATLSLAQIASGDTAAGSRTRERVHDADLLREIEEALSRSRPPGAAGT